MGRTHPARGDSGDAGYPGEKRQGALRGILELLRLAAHEGARYIREVTAATLRQPADPLYAAGERGRVRVGAGRNRPGMLHPRVESAGWWPAIWQVSA